MDELIIPKFSWGKTFDHNQGHTKNEWGMNDEEKRKIRIIEAYTVLGNLAKVKTGGLVYSHYD